MLLKQRSITQNKQTCSPIFTHPVSALSKAKTTTRRRTHVAIHVPEVGEAGRAAAEEKFAGRQLNTELLNLVVTAADLRFTFVFGDKSRADLLQQRKVVGRERLLALQTGDIRYRSEDMRLAVLGS